MTGKNFRKMKLQWKSSFFKWLFISTPLASLVEIWLLSTADKQNKHSLHTLPPSTTKGTTKKNSGKVGGTVVQK